MSYGSTDLSPQAQEESAAMVNRIIAGDERAQEQLLHLFISRVSISIGQIVQDWSAIEDIRQETFRIVIEKIRRGDVREPERVSGFILAVARNLALDYVRKVRRVKNQEELARAEVGPDAILMTERARRSVLDVLDGLPEHGQLLKTPAEADAYLQEERDSWDR